MWNIVHQLSEDDHIHSSTVTEKDTGSMPINLPDTWGIKKAWSNTSIWTERSELRTGDMVEILDFHPESHYTYDKEEYVGRRGIIDLDHTRDIIDLEKKIPGFIQCHIDLNEGFRRAFAGVKVKKVKE